MASAGACLSYLYTGFTPRLWKGPRTLIRKAVFFIVLFPLWIAAGDLYRGAELRTHTSYKYGRFEVNYKAAGGSGITSTFFTYYDSLDSYNRWNELDIEIMGRYNQDIQYNVITPGQVNHVSHHQLSFNPYNDFHSYAMEWTPDYVAWFVDGELTYKQTDSHIQTLIEAQKIMMNIWQPAYPGWAGDFDPRQLPLFAEYDWVQYSSYTPGSGNMGTDNNFTFQWRDDFDAYDESRWGKASHTWNGNNCLFTPENIVYHDGK
ncbi:MAG TPA: glycosyl hydrolase family protein, partial [Candidatus Marinimicrobia bacterium]|nr:glycosyl hydrolase family protein [Candidatus Neomarinimicrobiota bacterium]